MYDQNSIVKKLILELKKDLKQRDFTLILSKKCLEDLEIFYTECYLKRTLPDKDYFDKFLKHITILIGEIYIKENGGEWIFSNKNHKNEYYPDGIICKNGKLVSHFIYEIEEDLLFEEIEMSQLVSLLSAYSSIEIECNIG